MKTFDEWKNDGYIIRKGSRSVGKNENGECLFSEDQVFLPSTTRKFNQQIDYDDDDYDIGGLEIWS